MKRIAYIIPAYGCSEKMSIFKKIAKSFEIKGIEPVLVKIKWSHATHEDYLHDFLAQYREADKVYLFGFSFGAMIAFAASTKVSVKALILCSLSPYFKQDLPFIPKSYLQGMGKRRIKILKKLDFNSLAKKVKAEKTFLLLGDQEGDFIACRSKDAHKKIKGSFLITAHDGHDIKTNDYFNKINRVIESLD